VLPWVTGVIALSNIDQINRNDQINRKKYELAEQQQKRILIIDDEPDVNLVLQSVLEQNGYRTDSYTDPVAAYKNFMEGLYDLVILDIRMPVIDGFLLYQKIKATDSKVKICFLTATEYFREEIRIRQGVGDFKQELFLSKPIENEELVHTIKKLLESR
jgi:DNA-binding response OmpR family regulator